jgi:excisionase family DNA binding protein
MNRSPRQNNDALLYPLPEASRVSGVGRTMLYRLIRAGELRMVKIGNRSLIPAEDVKALAQRAIDGVPISLAK